MLSFIITISTLTILGVIGYAIIAIPSVDTSNRREYVYCPVSPLTLDSRTTYEINGCPTVRIYVNNWNNLDSLTQTSIDTQLRSAGFKDPSELGITS